MKAYGAYIADNWDIGTTVVFAETAKEAKKNAFHSSYFCDFEFEYIDIRVRRYPELDGEYRGRPEMDWDDPQDRLAMVKHGFTCLDDIFEPEDECPKCAGKDFCGKYAEFLKDVTDGFYDA